MFASLDLSIRNGSTEIYISCRELDSSWLTLVYFSLLIITATDETRLRDEFSPFGTVTDVFLPIDRNTSRPRGYVHSRLDYRLVRLPTAGAQYLTLSSIYTHDESDLAL